MLLYYKIRPNLSVSNFRLVVSGDIDEKEKFLLSARTSEFGLWVRLDYLFDSF